MLTALDKCPEWPVVRIISNGHWTDPVCELFAPTDSEPPTHLHIYKLTAFKQGLKDKKFTLPPTLKTCSLNEYAH